MYKFFSIVVLGLTAAATVRAAPTTLDAATLLKNGEDAQTLNKEFRDLKTTDPCKDGQTACIGKSIAKCQGTTWETKQGQCSRSQFCFALPSVSSPGTRVACTSQKSAESLITASGAVSGIFGQSAANPSTGKGDAVEHGPGAPSASPTVVPSTLISDFTPAATSGFPAASSAPAKADSNSSGDARQPCTMSMSTGIPSQPAPTAAPNTAPSTEPISLSSQTPSAALPSASPATSGVGPQRVTVTITLIPSQATTLAPQTRTISPQDASALIASVDAAAGSTVVSAPALPTSMSTTIPVSGVVGDTVSSASAASPVPTQGSYGGY